MSVDQIEISLSEVCELVTDGTHDSPKLKPSGVPFIKGKHISSGVIDFENCDFISEEDHRLCIRRVEPQAGDILMSNIGSVGDSAQVPQGFTFSIKNVALLRPNRSIVNELYFFYLFRNPAFKKKLMNLKAGSAQQYISLAALRGHRITIVKHLPTQERIAGVLSAYDGLIENNRRRIALLEQAARLLYREWFVHFRFPGSETAKFVDGLPEGWERTPFSDATFVNQKTVWDKNKYRYIRMVPMGALSESGMTCDSSKFERRAKPTGVKFVNGDTLFARITPCLENGKTAYVDFLEEEEVACGSTEFIVFRENKISKYMIYLLAREDGFRQNAVTSMVGSSGRQRVQNSCFDKFMVCVPPEDIASEFDLKAKPVFNQIFSLQAANHKLAKARELLLPRLMDGRLPIPE